MAKHMLKLTNCAKYLPPAMLATIIKNKRRENYAALNGDGTFSLHYQEDKARGQNSLQIINLRE